MSHEKMTKEELKLYIAKYLHGYWKDNIRPLLIGGHLSEKKRHQYSMGMHKWELIEPQYQRTYLTDAENLMKVFACNLDALMEYSFNTETEVVK
jgi:hypothetical protein